MYSISLDISEMQTKTTIQYHFTPISIAIMKTEKQKITNVENGVEKLKHIY